MATPPFDLNRFRRIFEPFAQSQGRSHGGWETENPPLPPYPLNPPFAPNMQPPPMLQGPPEPPPPEPMVGSPQRTPQTPLNPPRTPPMASSPRSQFPLDFPQGGPSNSSPAQQPPPQPPIKPPYQMQFPPVNPAQGMYEPRKPFNTEGWPIGEQYGTIDSAQPPPPAPTSVGMPPEAPIPESAEYPYLGVREGGRQGTLGGPNWPEEPIPGLQRGPSGGSGTGLRGPSELKPGTITNENMGDVPPYPEGMQRPSLDMGGYTNQMTDISDQAQANAPDEWFGQEGPQMPQSEEEQINQAISQWAPQTQMQQRLDSLLSGFPQREQDFSKWRKLGSFITGAGLGPEAQEKATYAPFYRQLGDWQAQMEPALKGAELERQGNINLRQLLHNEAMEKAANRRINVSEDAEARRERVRLDNVEKEKVKARISEMKADDANWEVKSEKGTGAVYMIHPRLGKRDMGIHVDDVTEEQKHRWRMDEIRERGRVTAENKPERWIPYDDYDDNGIPIKRAWNPDTKQTITLPGEDTPPQAKPPTAAPPAQTAPPAQAPVQQPAQAPVQAPPQTTAPVEPARGKPPSQADQRQGLETQVSRAKHKFPDYEEYINWDETTQLPDITKPKKDWMGFGSGWTPYTWEKYDEIGKFVFGPGFTREGGPTSAGGSRTTSRGTTVTRID